MRLAESIRHSGYFWLPDRTECKLPGILTITEFGEINLEVLGSWGAKRQINEARIINRINGYIDNSKYVTLDDFFYRHWEVGGIEKSTIFVHRAYIGHCFDNTELIQFNSISFSVEGLDEWLRKPSIDIDHTFGDSKAVVKYEVPDKLLPGYAVNSRAH